MKVLCLNTWGGQAGLDMLMGFFKEHEDVDIFCLQEVWNGGDEWVERAHGGEPTLLARIEETLPDHETHFERHFFDFYGMSMHVRKGIPVLAEGRIFIYREEGFYVEDDIGDQSRILQYVTVETASGPRTIVQFHGIWQSGAGKFDNPDRLEQSRIVIDFLKTLDHPYVLVGDFNILPDTKSLRMFETFGLRNLISENAITSTRTKFYTEPERFADYVFVSEGIEVKNFNVLPDEVSDHAPLYLECT